MGQSKDDFVSPIIARNQMVSTLVAFSRDAISSDNLNGLFQAVANTAVLEMGLPDCVVYQVSEDGAKLIQVAAHGAKSPEGVEVNEPLVLSIGQGVTGRAALMCRSLMIDDTSSFSDHIPDIGSGRSEIAVPIIHREMVIGVIDCEHPTVGYFNEEHLLTLEAIACIASSKISALSKIFETSTADRDGDATKVLELNEFRNQPSRA
ncbi:MAG: GAF domain-containing protein [Pseudomonadota bacterium]